MRTCLQIILCLLAITSPDSALYAHIDSPSGSKRSGPQRVRVQDGSTVHNVGELQLGNLRIATR